MKKGPKVILEMLWVSSECKGEDQARQGARAEEMGLLGLTAKPIDLSGAGGWSQSPLGLGLRLGVGGK